MFTGDSKEYFRQVGGLQHVQKLMFTEIPTPVLQAAMFCLACAIENQGLHQVLACLLFRHCPYFSIRWTYNRELWTENKLGSRFPLLFFKPNILFSSAPTPHTRFFVFFTQDPVLLRIWRVLPFGICAIQLSLDTQSPGEIKRRKVIWTLMKKLRRDQEQGGGAGLERERELDFICFSCFPVVELWTLSLWLCSWSSGLAPVSRFHSSIPLSHSHP